MDHLSDLEKGRSRRKWERKIKGLDICNEKKIKINKQFVTNIGENLHTDYTNDSTAVVHPYQFSDTAVFDFV